MAERDPKQDVPPPGSTRTSLGKIDFDEEVPLDREEESARKVDALEEGSALPDAALSMLFRTRLRELRPKTPVTVEVGSTVAGACAKMRANKIGCVLVMDGPKLAGIFTERDVLYKVTCLERNPAETKIDELMTRDPTTLRGGHRVAHALNKMVVDGCRHIPVVDESGHPTGVVSVRRVVDFIVEQFPEALLNLPPDPDQEMTRPEGG